MSSQTVLYIIIAGVISLMLVLFMYGYKPRYSKKAIWTYGLLRFVTLFSILVLIINPKFKTSTYSVEKPSLPILVDNSASIKELNQVTNVEALVESFKNNDALNKKFDLSFYSFGSDFKATDSFSFSEKNTNISKALLTTNRLYRNENAPTILISDGNQTLGRDYEFSTTNIKNPIYPIIAGDSITHVDLKIEQLNTNRYAFLKNKFPVEVILLYAGIESVSSQFIIKQGNTIVHRENVSFSEMSNSMTLSFTLPASSVGLQTYVAQLIPLSEEKNTTNNHKQFAVEIIDQATNVLIVSAITHPDIGAIKKSILSNEQRKVTIKKPAEALRLLNDYQLVILYQPDRSFAAVYSEIKKLGKNTFTFTGLQTDWNFLNFAQENFRKEVTKQIEDVEGLLNLNYGTFAIEDIGFNEFRPLKTLFGELEIVVPNEVIIEQSIDGFTTDTPLLATSDLNGNRNAIFDGEGLWRWRAQSFLASNSFEDFDNFIAKLVQYLASNERKSRLTVSSETFYYNNNPIRVSAQYFDKNYVFDSRVSLYLKVKNTDTNNSSEYPMLLKNNFFEVDLNSLPAGEYKYAVTTRDKEISRSGSFTILDFNVEQQFLNADVTKLTRIATNTRGKAYFISEKETLITFLLENDRFQQIQKNEEKTTPLIDWKYLLGLIVLTLSVEWFLRKYNGLI